jgi:hypothetical protein
VNQFHGIECEEWPARIAEVAMWMADHIANIELAAAFSVPFVRIPLKKSANIFHRDALEVDWSAVCPREKLSYIMGNPPFVGFVMRGEGQQDQAGDLLERLGATGKRLDYVAAWFLKAAEFIEKTQIKVALVATNSIAQGEQVAQLWPALFHRWNVEISFAHRPFVWTSEARGKAHVHVVIIGFVYRSMAPETKRLFSYPQQGAEPVETPHSALTAYLFEARSSTTRHLVVDRATQPISEVPMMRVGTKPVDGGHYIFDAGSVANSWTQNRMQKTCSDRFWVAMNSLMVKCDGCCMCSQHLRTASTQCLW